MDAPVALLYLYARGWLRYAKSTSQYSLAFSLNARDDWGFQVNSLCHHIIMSPFPPTGNEGYAGNRGVLPECGVCVKWQTEINENQYDTQRQIHYTNAALLYVTL